MHLLADYPHNVLCWPPFEIVLESLPRDVNIPVNLYRIVSMVTTKDSRLLLFGITVSQSIEILVSGLRRNGTMSRVDTSPLHREITAS